MVDVLALGPLEVHLEGEDYPIGGHKQGALLAGLVVARGRPLSVSYLCKELWPERIPRNPEHALQARVSRLRSALPSLEIELINGGYRLGRASFQTDIERFEALREEGGRMLSDGGLAQASERLGEALGLWRGRAFGDLPDVLMIHAEAARLERLRSSALGDRIDADLALGRETELIPELAAMTEQYPLIERYWGQLMTALYRHGHMQDALDTYARVRELSVEGLGVEPSHQLAELHMKILREEPSESLLRFPGASPILIETSSEDIPSGANSTITSCEVDRLAAFVKKYRAVIITGEAGVGKTHLLRAVREQFEGQRCLALLLSGNSLSTSIPFGVFAGASGAFCEDLNDPSSVIDSFARHRSTTVLLVDNVDLLDDSSLFVVTQLIGTSRVPAIIVTRSVTDAPAAVKALYDSGELTEVRVGDLDEVDALELATNITGGALTPGAARRILDAAKGNALNLREIVTGSLKEGRLTETTHGWELRGEPALSPRLAQLVSERFSGLDIESGEAAALVAIAGEYPRAALETTTRRKLARAGVISLSDNGWLRLTNPLDAEALRSRHSDVIWQELTGEVVQVLKSELAAGNEQGRHRADILALELDSPVDVPATIALAERALGVFDERLALRAAERSIEQEKDNPHAHRVAGDATSVLGMPDAADAHFQAALLHSRSDAERTTVSLAYARHKGLRLHDAKGALSIIDEALEVVQDPLEVPHLQRARMRWSTVAGMGRGNAAPPETTQDAQHALGLIVIGVSSVITGPLEEAHRTLKKLRQVPSDVISLVPGGSDLVGLTEIMALSYSGDITATQLQLQQKIAQSPSSSPESLGQWEYALGFTELFSGDPAAAHAVAASAVKHLKWRDPSGLLPAALALKAASALAAGHGSSRSLSGFNTIPEAAVHDPKVVMLRGWAEAWSARTEEKYEEASRTLVETAQWLLAAQHTYFAGMIAHCAVRTGLNGQLAVTLLSEARSIAGGGLLTLLLRHAEASLNEDHLALCEIATEASELGLAATAADTRLSLAAHSADQDPMDSLAFSAVDMELLRGDRQQLVSWVTEPDLAPSTLIQGRM